MLKPLLTLFGVLLGAEILRGAGSLPLPTPVIGLFVLAALLARNGTVPEPLAEVSAGLTGHMGLLFVPAGVGIVAQYDLLQREWMPIAVALVSSTVLGLTVTGAVMHWLSSPSNTAATPG